MKINLKTKNFSLTESIKIYLQEKLNSLDRFLPSDESISADVDLSKTTKHHQKGNVFRAEVNLKVPGSLIIASAIEWDLRVAIDRVKDDLQKEIKTRKEKNISRGKKDGWLFKKILRGEK